MRIAALAIFFVALGNAAIGQKFSLLPQVGFENTCTRIKYNDLSSFSPLCGKLSPQASVQLNYASKTGHGFFAGAATSQSIVLFEFTNPETAMSDYSATAGDMQVRLEGGYLFTSKRIALSNSSKSEANAKASSSKSGCQKKSSCSRKDSDNKSAKSKGSWMRLQPSLGMAYIPGDRSDIVTGSQNGQPTYEYRAGNWNTAVIAGAGFEFGKNNNRLFTVNVNYFQGVGNLGTETLTTQATAKTVETSFKSMASGWNLRVGIPFSLSKSKSVKPAESKTAPEPKKNCGQYKPAYRCGKII